eukprot:CAMPEP_0174916928 /NCGR_PEP_ID=MMETSP1355-20121228/2143_1 /TAXON_ID=464990 /ORGANISM="Hemiselmis tepida, Strain CCMP443" /LENGTH=183 /DNA_ID=CAMNT_0016161975 /DNA_START=197 /DNA_END=748 /DNA_ORIENTATION=+
MIFVPTASECSCSEDTRSLSRNASFDGVRCHCGRGCTLSLSNYAFSMELDDSLSIAGTDCACLKVSSEDSSAADSPSAMGKREHHHQQVAGRNCEGDGGGEKDGNRCGGGHAGEGGNDWWSFTGSLRASLTRLEGEIKAKGKEPAGTSGCQECQEWWEGGGCSLSQTPLSALQYRSDMHDSAA